MPIVPNREQEAAAGALRGKVLISAGAGSGKTRTLVTRFANALESHREEDWEPVPVDGILAITFTDKAAGEISERTRSTLRQGGRIALARQVEAAWIGTIHSFCTRVLRRYALEAGIDPAFAVADGVETERLREQAFERACASTGIDSSSALLGDFEFDDVYSAVVELVDHVRTSGLELADVKVERADPATGLLLEALEVLTEGREAVAACGDERAQATKLLDGCCAACGTLEEIDAENLSDPDLAVEVWSALAGFKPSGSAASVKEIVLELAESRRSLIGRAVSAAVRDHAQELLRLAGAYDHAYRRLKGLQGLLDFDDLQIETLRLLTSCPEVLAEFSARLRMVMVDEFQDTDELQLALVSLVAGEALCTVGDEQQSIYGFRGAAVDVYRAHNEAMRAAGAREFELSVNYRSHPELLGFVNHLFGGLFEESLIRLRAGREEPEPLVPDSDARVDLTLVRTGRGVDGRSIEAEQVAARLAELRDAHSVDPGAMVVLLRSYTHADAYADALASRGFAVSVVGGSRFFSVPSVIVGRAILAAIVNPHDDEALAVLLASQAVGVSDDGLWSLGRAARAGQGSLWESLREPPSGFPAVDAERLSVLDGVLERARLRVGSCRLSEVFLRSVEELGYDLALLSAGEEGKAAFANVLKLAGMADGFERTGGSGPAAFVAYLGAKEQYRDHTVPASPVDERGSRVRIMSIHASKGLEFPVVVLPELGASARNDTSIAAWRREGERLTIAMRLPSDFGVSASSEARYSELYSRIREDRKAAELEESQRLFYVGCTRARELLILSGSGSFSDAPKATSSLPIDWVRTELGLGEHDDGLAEIRTSAECRYLLRTIDAAAWGVEEEPVTSEEPASVVGGPTTSTICSAATVSQEPEDHTVLPERVSYSDFSLYESCAKRFWASKVMRVGSIRRPGGGDPLRFGSALHAALQLSLSGETPSDERLTALSRGFGLEASEITELREAVDAYLGSRVASEIAALDLVRSEWPFALPVESAHGDFALVGNIDAYGRSEDRALIIDYKSGRSGETSDLTGRYSLQAATYALAALRDGCTEVRVVFVRPQALDQDGQPQQVEFMFTPPDAAKIEEDLAERYGRIATDGYPELARWDPHTCGDCPISGSVCSVPPGEGWILATAGA